MPIGAVCGTEAVWEKIYGENPLAHTSTFGGNPLACSAALAMLEVLESENLIEKSRIRGAQMLSGFQGVQKRNPHMLSAVRGRGLMVGIEFAEDEVGELVVASLLKREVCVAYALNNPRVLRFEPPLIISEEQVSYAVSAVEEALLETTELLAMIG